MKTYTTIRSYIVSLFRKRQPAASEDDPPSLKYICRKHGKSDDYAVAMGRLFVIDPESFEAYLQHWPEEVAKPLNKAKRALNIHNNHADMSTYLAEHRVEKRDETFKILENDPDCETIGRAYREIVNLRDEKKKKREA